MDSTTPSDVPHAASIREQVFQEQLKTLMAELDDLKEGCHAEYNEFLKKNEQEHQDRLEFNALQYEIEERRIEEEYQRTIKNLASEVEEKRAEMRDALLADLEEKRRQIEHEYHNIELTGDCTELKPLPTRKLRRRPNEPVPQAEKRQRVKEAPQLTYRLTDAEIDDDLRAIGIAPSHRCNTPSSQQLASGGASPMRPGSVDVPQPRNAIAAGDPQANIERGQLTFDSKCYLRGQSVFTETSDLGRLSAVIQSINAAEVIFKSVGENRRYVITLADLQQGKATLKKRCS